MSWSCWAKYYICWAPIQKAMLSGGFWSSTFICWSSNFYISIWDSPLYFFSFSSLLSFCLLFPTLSRATATTKVVTWPIFWYNSGRANYLEASLGFVLVQSSTRCVLLDYSFRGIAQPPTWVDLLQYHVGIYTRSSGTFLVLELLSSHPNGNAYGIGCQHLYVGHFSLHFRCGISTFFFFLLCFLLLCCFQPIPMPVASSIPRNWRFPPWQ